MAADVSDDVSLVQSANDVYGADVADDASSDVADDVSFGSTLDRLRPTLSLTRPGQRPDTVNGSMTRPGQRPDPVNGSTARPGQTRTRSTTRSTATQQPDARAATRAEPSGGA